MSSCVKNIKIEEIKTKIKQAKSILETIHCEFEKANKICTDDNKKIFEEIERLNRESEDSATLPAIRKCQQDIIKEFRCSKAADEVYIKLKSSRNWKDIRDALGLQQGRKYDLSDFIQNYINEDKYDALRKITRDGTMTTFERSITFEKYSSLLEKYNKKEENLSEKKNALSKIEILYQKIQTNVDVLSERTKTKKTEEAHFNNELKHWEALLEIKKARSHNVDPSQRRMDSIARVLAVDAEVNPCIAVAFHENNLVIAGNTPKSLEAGESFAKIVKRKVEILSDFLLEVRTMTHLYQDLNFNELTRAGESKIEEYLQKLKACDGKNWASPQADRIRKDLKKLAKSYAENLKGYQSSGFSSLEANILELGKGSQVVTSQDSKNTYQAYHAEQTLAEYLFDKGVSNKQIKIGVQKLLCVTCKNYFTSKELDFRGASSVEFPNVVNMATHELSSVKKSDVQEYNSSDLFASDSESDEDIEAPVRLSQFSDKKEKSVSGEKVNKPSTFQSTVGFFSSCQPIKKITETPLMSMNIK